MNHSFGRRLLFAGVAAVAVTAAPAAPAQAAAAPIRMTLPDVAVAAGGNTLVDPILYADTETVVSGASMTFVLSSGLAGVSLAAPDDYSTCTNDGAANLVCSSYFDIWVLPNGVGGNLPAMLSATAAALGATGTLTVTFQATGVAAITRTVAVTVAQAVDLVAGADLTAAGVPGGAVDATLDVHNTTSTVVHGTALRFDTDYPFVPAQQFSNCLYAAGRLGTCTFDQDLQPGVSYQVVVPYRLRADTYAPGTAYGFFQWLPGDDWKDVRAFLESEGADVGTAGPGSKLELRALSAATLVEQTDPDRSNNWQSLAVGVTGANGVDLAAVGTTVTGAAGATVKAVVGVHNNGPATLDRVRAGSPAAAVAVTVPSGTTVTTVPSGCRIGTDATQYTCLSAALLPVGTDVSWEFGLQITTVVKNATGTVTVNPACDCDWFRDDTDKANDAAKLVVNPIA